MCDPVEPEPKTLLLQLRRRSKHDTETTVLQLLRNQWHTIWQWTKWISPAPPRDPGVGARVNNVDFIYFGIGHVAVYKSDRDAVLVSDSWYGA
jgi:hypothetical protein